MTEKLFLIVSLICASHIPQDIPSILRMILYTSNPLFTVVFASVFFCYGMIRSWDSCRSGFRSWIYPAFCLI